MKEVMAVIRMNRINETKRALSAAGISSFTATGKVMGRGKGLVDFSVLEGAKAGAPEAIARLGNGPRLVPKRILTVIVPDNKVETVIKTIISVNSTKNPGDGKIFVLPVADAYRVRTKEKGDSVLDNE